MKSFIISKINDDRFLEGKRYPITSIISSSLVVIDEKGRNMLVALDDPDFTIVINKGEMPII